jgi:hypothetical protein
MRPFHSLLTVLMLATALSPAYAAGGAQQGPVAHDDPAFGHALTLVQLFIRAASRSDDPKASAQALDELLAGRNPEANQAFSGLFEEATTDMSPQNKDRVAAIARDIAAMARKEAAKAPATPPVSAERALQARKDLAAMGLRYYDQAQFLDAVRRDDALAVELYLQGRGVNASARDAQGRTALDIARANKNTQVAELLARNLPAAR